MMLLQASGDDDTRPDLGVSNRLGVQIKEMFGTVMAPGPRPQGCMEIKRL